MNSTHLDLIRLDLIQVESRSIKIEADRLSDRIVSSFDEFDAIVFVSLNLNLMDRRNVEKMQKKNEIFHISLKMKTEEDFEQEIKLLVAVEEEEEEEEEGSGWGLAPCYASIDRLGD